MAICNKKPATIEEACTVMTRTVAKIAHKYAKTSYHEVQDYMQAGFAGVCQAYQRYNDKAGMAFSSYAFMYITCWVQEAAGKTWKNTNNTNQYVNIENVDEDTYELDIDSKIDLERRIMAHDSTTQFIVKARLSGYTFKEISEFLLEQGTTMSLHQARNKYLEVMED